MRSILSVLTLLALAAPSYAQDASSEVAPPAPPIEEPTAASGNLGFEPGADVNIMRPYDARGYEHVGKSLETRAKYHDHWYEYAGERYGADVKNPGQNAGLNVLPRQSGKDAKGNSAAEPLTGAQKMFEDFQDYDKDHDAKIADLYADDVVVKTRRKLADGSIKDFTLKGPAFKNTIPKEMAKARAKRDRGTYSDVTYVEASGGVHIKAIRESSATGIKSPVYMIAKPNDAGDWQIVEEQTDARF